MTTQAAPLSVPSQRLRALFAAIVVAFATGAIVLRPTAAPLAPDRRFQVNDYAGSAACAECHSHCDSFDHTPHARALLPTTAAEVARRVVGRQPPKGSLEFSSEGGQLVVRDRSDPTSKPLPVQWCFGSGETAQTFVTLLTDNNGLSRGFEHRWSWFVDGATLDDTPGQPQSIDESLDATDEQRKFGRLIGPAQTLQCFRCHTTAFGYSRGQFEPDRMIAGVQCEACHGPRQAHVAAQWAGVEEPEPPKRSARQQIEACGECHRRPDQVELGLPLDHPTLARFQGVGFVQSKCFLASESSGELVCTTCHDPHTAGRPPLEHHNNQCRNCHGPKFPAGHRGCKTMPLDSNCVDCHMPKLSLHARLKFRDHWIRVVR